MGPFQPSRYNWEGEKRKGFAMHIRDASSIAAHIQKAVVEAFYMPNGAPK